MFGTILKYVQQCMEITHVTALFIILNVLKRIPFMRPWGDTLIENKVAPPFMKQTFNRTFAREDWVDTFYGLEAYKHFLRITSGDLWKSVYEGGKAHNSELVNTDGKLCRLLDFQRQGRPLVVNFGSCT